MATNYNCIIIVIIINIMYCKLCSYWQFPIIQCVGYLGPVSFTQQQLPHKTTTEMFRHHYLVMKWNKCPFLNTINDIMCPVRPLPAPVTSAGTLLLSSRSSRTQSTHTSSSTEISRRKCARSVIIAFFMGQNKTSSLPGELPSSFRLRLPSCQFKNVFSPHGKVLPLRENVIVAPPGSDRFHPEAEELAATFHCGKNQQR